tara:strand:+ start:60356 stop:61081 length:726 start_codon:yes stop_codon:yes gene_type:complete
MKIALIQLGDKEYAAENIGCLHLNSLYCEKYGYSHIVESLNFPDIEATYQKPYILLKYMHDFDYVIWADLDSAIINHEIKLEDIINSYSDKDYLIFKDPGNWDFNAGILVFKNCLSNTKLLWQWWNMCPKVPHPEWRKVGGDQELLHQLLESKGPIDSLPAKIMNQHPKNFIAGDFLIHFMGYFSEDVKTHMCFLVGQNKDSEWNGRYLEAFGKIHPTITDRLEGNHLDTIKPEEIVNLML